MDVVRIGLIGTGFAKTTQIPAFCACKHATIVSIASKGFENARNTADTFDIPHFTDVWQETVDRDDIDLICITTPPSTHFEMTMRALNSGKHVLCEKPMAMNEDEALEMTNLAEAKGLMGLIDHELRFLPGRRLAFEKIRNGEIGKIIHAKQMFRNGSRGNPNLNWNWWSDINSGGGALGAIGSHAFDSFRWMLETEIESIFCQLETKVEKRLKTDGESRVVTTDDEANMILKFSNGELTENATGSASVSVVEAGPYEYNFEIFGTEGAFRIGEKGELFHARAGANPWQELDFDLGKAIPGVKEGGWSIGFMEFAKEIVTAIQSGKNKVKNAATFRDGLAVQKVLDASRRSNDSKCLVDISNE